MGQNICAGGTAKAAARPCTLVKPTSQAVSKVRTNIEIEDTYLQAVMDRYGLRIKTEAVELALRHPAGQSMTREEALAMRGRARHRRGSRRHASSGDRVILADTVAS
jgi:Arc/MetJ family transcription regulator